MAVQVKSREQIDRDWWDAWWAEDYSWEGLAKKKWEGWFVHLDGSVRGKEGEVWPPPPVVIPGEAPAEGGPRHGTHGGDGTGGAEAASSVSDLRSDPPPPLRGGGQPAALQDYWRRDPETGAVRTDAEMEAAGELVRDPAGRLWHIVHMPPEWRSPPLRSGGGGPP